MIAKLTVACRPYLLRSALLLGACWCIAMCGCAKSGDDSTASPATVLYCSVDETFAQSVIAQYERDTGRRVKLVTDTEGGKTTGLVKRLRIEKDRPRADVFWSSEQSQTVLLARAGVLAPYDSPSASDIPKQFKDKDHLWTGYALRARVVAYDPARTDAATLPKAWEAFAESPYVSRLAIANPLFGTTRGHVAAMHAVWGEERFAVFLTALVEGGVTVADGNSTAVRKLIAGDVDYAFTDSDDVITARSKGKSVAMVFPDMGDGGTMLIPNTVALVKGGPNPAGAKQLIDYILSASVEEMLARSVSGNYPVRASLREKLDMDLPPASEVSADTVADHMSRAIRVCREILLN